MLQYYYELACIYILYIATAATAAAHLHITIAPPSYYRGSAIVLARRASDSTAQHRISSPAAGVPSHPCQEHRAAQIESKNTRVSITVLIIYFVNVGIPAAAQLCVASLPALQEQYHTRVFYKYFLSYFL